MVELEQTLLRITTIALPAVVAITFHEAAHGWVAWKLGDDTAWREGRVTFNPVRHIDPFGTLILPALLYFTTGFLFGWAKPVPVNFMRLRNPRFGMVLVAAAGPGINLALAVLSAFLLRFAGDLPDFASSWAVANLTASVFFNAILAAFNMIPLPPLDGGRVAVGLLPRPLARPLARLEHWGLFILIGLLVIVPMVGSQLGHNVNILSWLLMPVVEYIIHVITVVTGIV
ncbi:MAG TPA: site-2 protease family protein [Azospirillaceae bacterium]|nr:site-2 protease family protein [Azospirillaceae bacterium]